MRILRKAALASVAGAVMLAASVVPAWAQATGSVSGSVTDAVTARPLSGVQVFVAGTNVGTLTNSQGDYLILNVPVGTATIRTSMIGFAEAEETVTVSAGQAASANFALEQSAVALDAVVVTGTAGGSQQRAIGNVVSSVDAAAITATIPVSDVQELLTARTPGVTILSSSGQAGASSKIRIRGAGSLEGGLEPVIYIDGIRAISGTFDGYSVDSGVAQGTNPLDLINPNDIASIEVIKGPAAATLYGAEAAGGVIQIITKKGSSGGDVQWSAGFETGKVDWHARIPTTYTLCDEEKISNDDWPGCAGVQPGTVLTDQPLLNNYECQYIEDCHPNALRTGGIWGFDLSARGGGENYSFYISGEHNNEDGVFWNNFSKRTSGRANFGFTPSEVLNFQVNMAYVRGHVMMPLNNNSSNSVLRNGMRGRPGFIYPWAPGFKSFSPEISNEYDNQNWNERTTLGMTVNYNPVDWLQNRLTVGMDKNDRLNQLFYRLDETGLEPWGETEATGEIDRTFYDRHVWTLDYAGTVNSDIGTDYTSNLSAGMQLTAKQYKWHEVAGEGLVANKLNLVGSAAVTTADEGFEEQNSLGFYVQEQVGWRNRLFGTVAVRVDDNSAFGREFSLVVYPKASLSYVISDEEFFDLPHVDELRLRGAWGRAGNAPEPFSADRSYEPEVSTFVDESGNQVAVNYISPDAYGNENLKAETGSEIELGFDAGLFGGRMGIDFTYYNQHTYDALIEVPDPRSSGFTEDHLINVGHIRNSGLELLLTGTPIYTRDVVWDAALSLSTNSNELVSFGGVRNEPITFGAFADVQKHAEGYPLGGYWPWDVERDESGQPILRDANGNIVDSVEEGDVTVLFDEESFVGPMLPTRQVALSNTVTLFGNLRLYANLDYKGGNYQWCAICSINSRIDRNNFHVNNPDADPRETAVWLSRQTKTHVMPADFIKLRELSATYTLPDTWSRAFRAEQASITLSGRNLWMWTKYEGPNDPEVTFYSRSDFNQLDYASAPMMRQLGISLRFTF